MHLEPLDVHGAYLVSPTIHEDSRGLFQEIVRLPALAQAIGRPFTVAQSNLSVSHAGVVRGIHWTDYPPGQAKYVTCVRGAVFDVVVDLRIDSPSFGRWAAALLDDESRRAVFVPEGMGHGFCALTDQSTVSYLCSSPYQPEHDRAISPFDETIAIAWPTTSPDGDALTLHASVRDESAPSFVQIRDAGALPRFHEGPVDGPDQNEAPR